MSFKHLTLCPNKWDNIGIQVYICQEIPVAYFAGGYDGGGVTPAIQPLRGNKADANRAKAAAKALEDQEPGSESTIQMPGDVDSILDRLEEIRTEMGELYNKLYATSASKKPSAWMGYSGPIYQVRMAIQADLDTLSVEESGLQRQLQDLRWILPPTDDNENEEDPEDATQPDED